MKEEQILLPKLGPIFVPPHAKLALCADGSEERHPTRKLYRRWFLLLPSTEGRHR